MTRRTNIQQLSKRDRDILYHIHRLRFVTMEQLRMISDYGKSYTFAKAREYQELGVLDKKEIVGSNFYRDRDRQGIYMYMRQKGINYLQKHGYETTSTARENRNAKPDRILAILKVNHLALHLEPFGWKFLDGRDAKRGRTDFQNAILHGSLQNAHSTTEYGVYMLMGEDNEATIKKIKNQTPKITGVNDYLIVTRTSTAVKAAIEQIEKKEVRHYDANIGSLIVGGKLCVLPGVFAQIYLPISEDNEEKHRQFLEMLGFQILDEDRQAANTRAFSRFKFDFLVQHPNYPGEELYLANLLDNDLSKIKDVRGYNKDRYTEDGRRALLLTTENEFHKPVHEAYLYGPHYVFHSVPSRHIINARKELHPGIITPKRKLKHQGKKGNETCLEQGSNRK